MITLDLPVEAERLLSGFAREEQVSAAEYARTKLLEFLEDEADCRLAQKRWEDVESGRVKTIPSWEVERAVGL